MVKAKRKSTRKASNYDPIRDGICRVPEAASRAFGPEIDPVRAAAILSTDKKWVNGTKIHYYLYKSGPWKGANDQYAAVRRAFKAWKDIGIGLEFAEVNTPEESEVRIGFLRGDGSWSYVGRDVLQRPLNQRTMNFGWNIASTSGFDTALHEIGHTLGRPHEHQNPNAGIDWDEDAVYAALAKPPNRWSRQQTFHNIIRKIDPDSVQGSAWDPKSIMHYPFEAALIDGPAPYSNTGIFPPGGLSPVDKKWMKVFYPPLKPADHPELKPFRSAMLSLAPGAQANFLIKPTYTRRYNFRTFGASDTVMVLFERSDGELRYRTGDDDSGEDRNASFGYRLTRGREYVLRIRLYYSWSSGETAVMYW